IEAEAPPEPVPVDAGSPKEVKVARSRRTPLTRKAAPKAEPRLSSQLEPGEAESTSFWEETALEEKPAPKPRKSRRRSKPDASAEAAVEPSADES
ncbi:MAG: hypothetical protein LC732_05845, partial [Acidobacteria bacterium]|nr:hypothetical protein [Acidobacteriota bacterium]